MLEVIEKESLIENAASMEVYIKQQMTFLPDYVTYKGRGLMFGLAFPFEVTALRKDLLFNHHIFTGAAKDKKVLRILPALNIERKHIDQFFSALKTALSHKESMLN